MKNKLIFLVACVLVFAGFATVAYADDYVITYDKLDQFKGDSFQSDSDSEAIGWCQCKFSYNGAKKSEYVWDFYTPKKNETIFTVVKQSVLSDPNASSNAWLSYVVNFSESGQNLNCIINPIGGTVDTQTHAGSLLQKNSCSVKKSYCCCEFDPKTGTRSNCARSVSYDTDNGRLACQDPKKAYPDNGQGCVALQSAKVKTGTKAEADKDLERSIKDLTQDASALNKVKFANLNDVIGQIIYFFLATVGTFAFVLYAYAGVIWLTSAGNSERIERSKQMFLWITLGLFAMLGSYIVVKEIFNFINNTTGL